MTIVMWICVHPYKATHTENRESILHFIVLMVLHTDSYHNDHINHRITVYTKKTNKSERKQIGQLWAAIAMTWAYSHHKAPQAHTPSLSVVQIFGHTT